MVLAPLSLARASGSSDVQALSVHLFDSGEPVVTIDLPEDAAWVLQWRHSVTGILVKDYFAVREGQMMLEQSHMPAFDAGLGHIPGRGRLESDGANGYWVRNIDEPIAGNRFVLRVGDVGVNDHTLIVAGQQVNLSTLVPRQRVVMTIGAP